MLPVRNADHSWARNNMQKSNRFKEHLECTFQSNKEEQLPYCNLPDIALLIIGDCLFSAGTGKNPLPSFNSAPHSSKH